MANRSHCFRLGIASCVVLLSACGGSGGGSSNRAAPEPQEPVAPSFGALKPAEDAQELVSSLQQGLSSSGFVVEPAVVDLAAMAEGGVAGLAAGSGNFTTTNLQEAGVDEADILKYDGEILYFIQRGGSDLPFEALAEEDAALIAPVPQNDRIHLLRTDVATPSAAEVATIEPPVEGEWLDGLYLHSADQGKSLIALGSSQAALPWEAISLDYYWQEGKTSVTAWDVANPAAPAASWRLELEGSLLASRRIGDRLYLVTRYTPTVDGVIAYPEDQEQIDANQALIADTPLEDLLPDYWMNGGPAMELLAAQDCYLPNPEYQGGVDAVAGGGIVTVTAVDLTGTGQPQSLCLNTNSSGYYVSPQNLYITWGGNDNATLVHKIRLGEDGPAYRGSGEVPGYLGTQNPAFLMSEAGEDLRVVSSLWTARPEPFLEETAEVDTAADYGPHRLTVLRENGEGTELEQLAQIPNASQPEKIGKPGEQIYAARFLDDRAYIVTFEVIDPLYVIDLSSPEAPRISGELELPGFSTLLQPLGANLLLGVGNEVPPEAEGLVQGIKVALFDVADLEAPLELASEVIGKRGSYSPALYNHHALTVQDVDSSYRVTLPVVRHAHPVNPGIDPLDPAQWYDWSDSGLYLFDILPATGSLSLRDTLVVEQRSDETPWPHLGLHDARAVIHDNALFLVLGERVWARQW